MEGLCEQISLPNSQTMQAVKDTEKECIHTNMNPHFIAYKPKKCVSQLRSDWWICLVSAVQTNPTINAVIKM